MAKRTHEHKIGPLTGYGPTAKAAQEAAQAEAVKTLSALDAGPTSFAACPTNDPKFAVAAVIAPALGGGWSYTLIRRAPAFGSCVPLACGIATRHDAAMMAARHLIQQAIPCKANELVAGSENLARLIDGFELWILHDLPINTFSTLDKTQLRADVGEEILRMRESLHERAIANEIEYRHLYR